MSGRLIALLVIICLAGCGGRPGESMAPPEDVAAVPPETDGTDAATDPVPEKPVPPDFANGDDEIILSAEPAFDPLEGGGDGEFSAAATADVDRESSVAQAVDDETAPQINYGKCGTNVALDHDTPNVVRLYN